MDRCFHAVFSGVVQGVGFRFTTRALAARFKIKGWVRNLTDGRVEVLAAGTPTDLDNFFRQIKTEFRTQIEDWQRKEISLPEQCKGFEIKF